MWILWLPLSGQTSDSILFSSKEARTIALRLIELKECRELLTVAELQMMVCDSLQVVNTGIITMMASQANIQSQVIQMHLSDKSALTENIRLLKRRNVATIGICAIVSALSLFIAIR